MKFVLVSTLVVLSAGSSALAQSGPSLCTGLKPMSEAKIQRTRNLTGALLGLSEEQATAVATDLGWNTVTFKDIAPKPYLRGELEYLSCRSDDEILFARLEAALGRSLFPRK